MAYITVVEQFNMIRAEGILAPIQINSAMVIWDAHIPECVEAVEMRDKSHILALGYPSVGVKILIDRFNVTVVNMIEDSHQKFLSGKEALPYIYDLLTKLSKDPQAITTRAIASAFPGNLVIERVDRWCYIRTKAPVNGNTIKLTVRGISTDVVVCNSSETVLAEIFETWDSEQIIKCISGYIGANPPDAVRAPNEKTGIFAMSEDVPRKINLHKPAGTIAIDDIKNIISSLMNTDNENCVGTFSDGWKEALSAINNRLANMR